MGFNSALTTTQYNLLRGSSYASDYLITLCTNRVVFAGQITPGVGGTPTWAKLGYTNVSVGAYTDVEVGQVVIVQEVNSIGATPTWWRGRIRKAADSSYIYVNESAILIANLSYFWVIDSYDPVYRQNHPSTNDPATAVQWVDYDITYKSMQPAIIGIRTAYASYSTSGAAYRIAFDASASYAAESGATISSYQYTFKAATYSVVSGALNTAIVTVDITNNTEQWGKLVVTDSNGTTATRRFFISTKAPTLTFNNLTLEEQLGSGWTLKATGFAGVDSVLPDTFAVCWRQNELFNNSANTLVSNNVSFVGWLQRESDNVKADPKYSVMSDVPFEFTGIGPRLARMELQALGFTQNASPANWGDINNLTPWRAIKEYLDYYTTVTELCEINFDSHDNTFLFPTLITQGSSSFDAINGIAAEIGALFEFAPDGRILCAREYTYLTSTQRNALTTVGNWTSQDAIGSLTQSLEENRGTGVATGTGAWYNPSTGQFQGFTIMAPANASEGGASSTTLQNQIAASGTDYGTALSELLGRVGAKLEYDNNTLYITQTHKLSYAPILICSHSEYWTWTLDATLAGASGPNRILWDTSTKWTIESVSIALTGNGAGTCSVKYHWVQGIGTLGLNTTVYPSGSVEPAVPDLGLPAFNFELPDITFPDPGLLPTQVTPAQLAPPTGTAAKVDGSTVIVKNATSAWLLQNVLALTTPQAQAVTPTDLGSYTIAQVLFDPFYTTSQVGCYILATDGSSHSAVWYTPNVITTAPVWTKGVVVSGLYTIIRAGNAAGTVALYGGAGVPTTYDFTSAAGPFTIYNDPTYGVLGTYVAGVGYQSVNFTANDNQVSIVSNASQNLTAIVLHLNNGQVVGSPAHSDIESGTFGSVLATQGLASGVQSISWSGTVSNTITLSAFNRHAPGGAVITLTSVDFYAAGSGANVVTSTNFGATFGSPQTVGSAPPSGGGFDVQLAGTGVNYGAALGAVYKASTLGGAYSSWYSIPSSANAMCLIVPWYKRNSLTLNTSTSTPDVLAACDNGKLFWIDGATATATDITPSGVTAFALANCLTTSYGNHIACFGSVSGVQHLFTSTNGGTSWTDRGALSTPGMIRGRRKDTRASASGNHGQCFLIQNTALDYTSIWWGSGALNPRTMPASVMEGLDILG